MIPRLIAMAWPVAAIVIGGLWLYDMVSGAFKVVIKAMGV